MMSANGTLRNMKLLEALNITAFNETFHIGPELDILFQPEHVLIALYVPLILLSLGANVILIVVAVKCNYTKSVTNIFLVNLSAADLLVCLVCMPIQLSKAITLVWFYGETVCKIVNYIQGVAVAASVFTLTAMSVDRWLSITPEPRLRPPGRRQALMLLSLLWVAALFIFIPLVLVASVHKETVPVISKAYRNISIETRDVHFCTEEWPSPETRRQFGTFSFTLVYAIPGSITILSYACMGRTLCSVRPPFDIDEGNVSMQQGLRLMKERKRVAWILLLLAVLFALCWMPYNIMQLLLDINAVDAKVFSMYLPYALFLGHANSAINPIVYCLMTRNFQRSARKLLCGRGGVCQQTKFTGSIGTTTTLSGFPVAIEDTDTINSPLIFNDFFMELTTHLNRERIPERIVHAKGTGAHGYFKVTHDLSDICRAKVFSAVGKKTPVTVRFSSTVQQKGGSDLAREIRGFSIKFYTEEGNYDLTTLNTEMFLIKDPILFPDFVHSFGKNQKAQVNDWNTVWDFLTLHPETLSAFMRVFGDWGIPNGYRYMPGFGIHTFEMINDAGERNFVRIHVLPDAEIKTFTTAEAAEIQADDLDFANRDLYDAIANHEYPSWTLSVQVISYKDAKKAKFDIFDVSKYWPLKRYPLRPVGKLTLNRNPINQFAEIEQLAFNPGNLVPGIRGVDKLFEARVLSYRDAQNYRLGANFNKIKVNCPRNVINSYVRDGRAPVLDNGGGSPNYFLNSFNGSKTYSGNIDPPRLTILTNPKANNFQQAAYMYRSIMSAEERCRLVETISSTLRTTERFIQDRAVVWYTKINLELGIKIQKALRSNKTETCDWSQQMNKI